ncbi:unnamed protein product [Ectocarpus sp. 6 AP-2014]
MRAFVAAASALAAGAVFSGPLLASAAVIVVVEAVTVTTVEAEASLFDSRLAAAGGCDPAGCSGDKTRGDTRTRTMDVYVDQALQTSWTSSGTTNEFETVALGVTGQTVELRGVLADSEWLSITEVRALVEDGATDTDDSEFQIDFPSWATELPPLPNATWRLFLPRHNMSIMTSAYVRVSPTNTSSLPALPYIVQVEIMVLSGDGLAPPPSPPTTTPAPVFAPVATATPTVATPEQLWSAKEIETQDTTVTTTADLFDPALATDNGCDPAGCTAALTRDGDTGDASRWSCAPNLGGEGAVCSISYDLGREFGLDELRVALYNGDIRVRTIDVSVDGVLVATWASSGTTDGFESIAFPDGVSGTVINLQGVLDDSEWLSIIETEIMVWPQNVVTPPPTPATTAPPAPAQPATTSPIPTPVGDLQPVGLIPLATGDGSLLDRYAAKDGDLSTSWTCTGDPREVNLQGILYYECSLLFDLVYTRHIKQVKIALADGAERAVDMSISRGYGTTPEELVTSSGTTDGLETYDVDYKTSSVRISGAFSSPGQSISISEVEFVEEVVDSEVLLETSYFDDYDWNFELSLFNRIGGTDEPYATLTGLEITGTAEYQSIDLTGFAGQYVTSIAVHVEGSGGSEFPLIDARILGTKIDNPTDTFYVGSTFIPEWYGHGDPDFVGQGTGDQNAINAAICAVKKGTYDGVDCVGMDDSATGTVVLAFGEYHVDGNIFMKSGVFLKGRYRFDDSPYNIDIFLEEGAPGNTDVDAMIVMDGISDARIGDLWIHGLYDPDTSNDIPAVPGLGSTGVSIVDSQNITCADTWIDFCDGDAMVVRSSSVVNIDAGYYDEYKATEWRVCTSWTPTTLPSKPRSAPSTWDPRAKLAALKDNSRSRSSSKAPV